MLDYSNELTASSIVISIQEVGRQLHSPLRRSVVSWTRMIAWRLYRIPTASVTENDGSVAAHDAASQKQRTQYYAYIGRRTQDGDAVRER